MRALLLALACASIVPSAAAAQASRSDEARHVLPIRYADRPLTLPEGTFRLDQSLVLRVGSGLGVSGPNALYVGLTDWLELGVSWPWTRDPTFLATARVAHGGAADLGFRVNVTVPAITTGNTVLVVSMPIVFRIAHIARIATSVTGDFLLTPTAMQPIVRVPLSIVFSTTARSFLGLEGSIELVDRRLWQGSVGIFYGHTSATPLRPFGEPRIGMAFDLAPTSNGGPNLTFSTYVAFSFWTTVNPIEWQ